MRLPTVLLTLAAFGGAGLVAYGYYHAKRPYKGYSQEDIFFVVSPGASSRSIARELENKGIIENRRLFLSALWLHRANHRLQAGEYRFAEPLSTLDVIDRLLRGDVYYRTVTVPEGLTLLETAALFEKIGLGSAEAYREAFGHSELVASLDPEASDLEGYLYPETYQLPREPDPWDVVQAMVQRFLRVFDSARRDKAQTLGLSPRQVVTLASIVEKETGRAEERPLIASVFWNRLKRRMALQSDPTIIYELKRRGVYNGNLRRADLESDSPYNTYLHRGLPPGPIASPGKESIDAVLYPTETKYLYFVSKNDGSHYFSRTLKEHTAAVRRFQIEFFRNQRRRKQSTNDSNEH